MLLDLFNGLAETNPDFSVFAYITLRGILGALTALAISLVLGPAFIRRLVKKQVRQPIRKLGPESHFSKAGTPTMGGTLIIVAIVVSILLWSDLTKFYVWITLFVIIGYGLVGFIDDYLMQVKKQSKGLSVRTKLVWQAIIALIAGFLVYISPDFSTQITIPFFKNVSPDFGW